MARHLSEQTLRERSTIIRPQLPPTGLAALHHTQDLLAFGIDLGSHRTRPLYGSLDQTFLLLAGPRAEKGRALLHQTLINAPGAALITCPDAETWAATAAARRKLGPVHVHDPLQLTDASTRLRWAPEDGCADPATATARARAMLFPLRPPGRPALADSALAARLSHGSAVDDAQSLLACWLHAAALDGRTFNHVHRWSTHPTPAGQREPIRVLRTSADAAPGWDGRLESHFQSPEQTAAVTLVQRALAATGELHVLQSCRIPASSSERFDVESWVRERGTLYVVGEPVEDPRSGPGVLPLSTALVESVVERGRRIAVGSSSGRLDPPLLLLLDEVATVAPLPGLPELMAGGGTLGLPTMSVLRSPEQARHRWGAAAGTISRAAGIRLAMGEVSAYDLASAFGIPATEAEALAETLRQGPAGTRVVHHAAVPPVLAEPSPA